MAGMLPRHAEAVSLAIFGLALSCQREAPPVAQEAKAPTAGAMASPSPAPTADAPAPAPVAAEGPGKSRYDETSFALTLEPAGEYAVGKEGAVTLTLKAAPPYKVNDQYPHKFKAKEGAGVKYAAAVVGKDKAKLDKQSLTMPVAFSAETPGKVTVAGQFLFSVCTDENCLMEKRDLALTVDVK